MPHRKRREFRGDRLSLAPERVLDGHPIKQLSSSHGRHGQLPPLMLEHLSSVDEYRKGADYIRKVATDLNIAV